MNTITVGELARISGVSIRTLHHYDEIGLLKPAGRTDSGYRLYGTADVDRLRLILTYRALDLALDDIGRILEDGDAIATLRGARDRVSYQIGHLQAIRASLDSAIESAENGTTMTPEEKLSVFGDFDPDEHRAEAEDRWGQTDAYIESTRRAASYEVADWERIRTEADAIYTTAARCAAEGIDPDGIEAVALVESHRDHITHNFYECTPEIHAGLGRMYVEDPRFTANIDKAGAGTAAFLADAIAAYYG
ncbi:MAG TPA: MerR family transcriptional regulator [Acidimicrobiia bacterium]|nr:MerR family transcriptional regulator [Acidimicrobiia bacterium]